MTINNDGSVTVEDDGRGIPVEVHPDLGFSTLQGVMTVLKFGGKFDKGAYQTSGGLHGVGVTVVNFLSEWCEVEVRRDGHVYQQEYERGVPVGRRPPHRHAPTAAAPRPPSSPTAQIFPNTKFDYNILYRRLQELAFLNRGVKIVFKDQRTGDGETFHYERGILRVRRAISNRASEPAHADIIYIAGKYERRRAWKSPCSTPAEFTENVHSYVNNINTIEGGTHLSGFRTALTRTLNAYGKKENLFKDLVPSGDDCREGLTARDLAARARAAVRRRRPRPSWATAKWRASSTRRSATFSASYLEENPEDGQASSSRRPCWRPRPAKAPARPGPWSASARGPCRRRPARQTPRLHQPRRGTLRAVPGRGRFGRRQRRGRPHARSTRRSCRCAARSSTPTSRATTRCWPTKRSAASSRPWARASATRST